MNGSMKVCLILRGSKKADMFGVTKKKMKQNRRHELFLAEISATPAF